MHRKVSAMSTLRLIVASFIMMGSATAAFAADNKKLIVARWEVVDGDESTLAKGSTAEFTADGKIKVVARKNNQDENIDGTYTIEGDTLTLKVKADGSDRTVKITIKKLGDTDLTLEGPDGKTVVFKNKK